MSRYIIKWGQRVFLFGLPFIIPLLIYIVLDPFKVIRKYDNFYVQDGQPCVVWLDRGYVGTVTFDNNYSSSKYDSFIFGNSRSIFYEIDDWKHYIDTNSRCFHFDASGESLYGMYKKIKYVDRKNANIRNVLLVMDYHTLSHINPATEHLNVNPPQVEDYKNIKDFHLSFIKAFSSPKFIIAYYNYKIFGKIDGRVFDVRPREYDLETNEMSFPYFEQLIENGEYHTPERMRLFYFRDSTKQSVSPACIGEQQKQILMKMHAIFQKHGTHLKIIISPLYNQEKLNEQDVRYLKSLFGKENVFDFSGINEFTNDFHNYYEDSHYRPHVAREILKRVYQ
ncbi:hypothetical protein FACS1894182_07960 [Bacteroidia bacterium]|nr:hypothetical protein FACS1894182_07960 [Bacteroidia bacterium]